jgi:thioredoxin reductase (NADPH)
MEISYLETDLELEQWKKDYPLVVVDFFSDDCPPCEKLAPIYEKMAKNFPAVKFVKVFRQQHRDLAKLLEVSGSPTVLFFKEGQLQTSRLSGDIAEHELNEILVSLGAVNDLLETDNQASELFHLCIIGNGPAGMTAAIYAARYKINQVMVGDLPGGLMMSSHKICNFPSQLEISGQDLTQKMSDQVVALEVPQKLARVETITKKDGMYHISLSNDELIRAKTILLATGTKHRHLNLVNEKALAGRGVSYCATCDAMFYRNKVVAVVGGSDSANTAALYLAQLATKVYQIYRGDALRGEVAWIDQIKVNDKITVLYNTQVTELIGVDKLTGIKLDKLVNGQNELMVDGVFVEVGSEPELYLIDQLELAVNKGHYIVTKDDQTTSQIGVWAAGDITTNSNSFRQIITACSEGAIAAESIFKYLQINK